MATTKMIAAFQGNPVLCNIQDNLRTMRKHMEVAAKAGASLIVFPELFTTGYYIEPDQMRKLSEPKNGSTFQQISQWSKELGIAVLYGYPEQGNINGSTVYYNSAMFVGSDGSALGNYRKQHLWVKNEEVFTPGDQQLIVTYEGMKIGVLICYDVEFPEAVRSLALEGVQVVLVPTALLADTESDLKRIPKILVPARALENCVFVAYVNHEGQQNGQEFLGSSCIYAPNGEPVLVAGKGKCLLFANIDISLCQFQNNQSFYFRERRPKLYGKLVHSK